MSHSGSVIFGCTMPQRRGVFLERAMVAGSVVEGAEAGGEVPVEAER